MPQKIGRDEPEDADPHGRGDPAARIGLRRDDVDTEKIVVDAQLGHLVGCARRGLRRRGRLLNAGSGSCRDA